MRYTCTEVLRNFLQTVETIYHNCLSGHHRYTCGQLADANALSSERNEFKFHVEGQSIWISLGHFQIPHLISSLPPPSCHFQFITSYRTNSVLTNAVYKNKSSYSLQMWTACNRIGTKVRISKGKECRNFMGIFSETIIKLSLWNCLKPSFHPVISTENLANKKRKPT